MFYRKWQGVSIEKFNVILNEYIIWYNSKRIKKSLGYKSPINYRKSLGLKYYFGPKRYPQPQNIWVCQNCVFNLKCFKFILKI